jgi:hypothetical protein
LIKQSHTAAASEERRVWPPFTHAQPQVRKYLKKGGQI